MILDIINEIASIGSTKEKEAIIRRHKDNELLKRVFRMTYDGKLQYYIKKWDTRPKGDIHLTLEDMLYLLEEKLAKRVVTGNAAKEKLEIALSQTSDADAEVVKKVLLRDLRCGASRSIANKVWKNLIPEQPQMLASSYDEKGIEKNIKFPAFAQLKADGARAFAEVRGDELDDVKILSRAGNEYLGLDLLKQQLIEMTKEARERHPGGVMIDGELVYHASTLPAGPLDDIFGDLPELSKAKEFKEESRTMSNGLANKSLKGTISAKEAAGMKFQVWDYVPLDVVYSEGKQSGFAYDVRFRALELMVQGYSQMILIENHIVHNLDEAKVIYRKYVDEGLEGIILKNIGAFWENTRSKNLYKFKEVITIDLRIVDIYEHSKQPGKAGGFYLESECGLIKVKAGSGLKDKPGKDAHELDRTRIWENKNDYIGGVLESECNGWLAAEGRTDYVKLFLPIAIKMRRDKDVANTFADIWGDFHEVTGL
ncbi:gp30 DNA ligase [Enterobacter phage CC31]|uniref:DNA ligase n=1 Tax=Enterobacter phage CC31 TaxID=709484 RepID=E5DHT3_9CAUD|nr:gp30 DNA ligase [Enterobacter phage CC31]ADB81697.1 gp30 DNA ligase [Enterobacter phage CC31]